MYVQFCKVDALLYRNVQYKKQCLHCLFDYLHRKHCNPPVYSARQGEEPICKAKSVHYLTVECADERSPILKPSAFTE